jgi:hypothetical protein
MIAGARPRPDGGAPEERDQDLAAALASGRAVRLEPTEPLASGTSYICRCGPGLRPQDGGEGLARAHDEVFTTYGPADIKTIEPQGRDIAADGVPIKIEFATPMDPNQVRQARAPALAGGHGGGAGPVGELPANGVHLVGRSGARRQLPAGDRRRGWSTPSGSRSRPSDATTSGWATLRPGWRPRPDLHGRASQRPLPDVDPQPVARGSALRDRARGAPERRADRAGQLRRLVGRLLPGSLDWKQLGLTRRSQQVRPDAARNRWHDQTLDLASACGVPAAEPVASGVYLLEIVTDEERNREAERGPARAAVAGERHRPGAAGQGGQRLVAGLGGAAVHRGAGGGSRR